MRPLSRVNVPLLWVAMGLMTLPAKAQDMTAGTPKLSNVCINLDTNYARIDAFLSSLAKFLTKNLPHAQKGIRVVAAGREPSNPAEAARAKGCQYLLQLSLVENSGARVGFDVGSFKPPTAEAERDLQQLAVLEIKYRLSSLENRELDVHDSSYVGELEYPSIWDAAAFETTVDRATERVASAGLKNLPKN